MTESPSTSANARTKSEDDQLVKALHAVLEHATFKFTSKATTEARKAAVLLLDWATKQENLPVSKTFLQQLQQQFEDCLKFLNPGSINRDRLWRSFFILRSSNKFIKAWNDFLLTAKVNPITTLYQQLTSIMSPA